MKRPNRNTIINLAVITSVVGGAFAFVWRWQAAQDSERRMNMQVIERLAEFQENHVVHATAAFERLDATLTEQVALLRDTRELMSRLQATQEGTTRELERVRRQLERLR